ncbi:hypothetical protein D6825_04045 [Candidatus Woesearchaeota archaeon]|nr:MAG: hypothetical protein D6825_04045 [Candidatus Woesearchaeota archaeon]
MATPLDVTALQGFKGVFPFLFILVFTYAILISTSWFKDKQFFAAIIAFALAFMSLLSPVVTKTVALMMPWLVLFFIFIVLLMIVFMATGVKGEYITDFIKEGNYALGLWMFVIFSLIAVGSLMFVLNEETGGIESFYNESQIGQAQGWAVLPTIFHPKFLGMVLVLLIAVFTVRYMTSEL